ncbi:hypothetical protein Tco_1393777 [Tanacetum coccineum]
MTPATSSSGLVPTLIPQQPSHPPNRDDWVHLFKPMFDEYFNPPTFTISPVLVAAKPRAVDIADSPVSTSINQDAPSTSIPSIQEQEHSLIISQGTDTRPPMLVESDYDSWKIRIHRFCLQSACTKEETLILNIREEENKLELAEYTRHEIILKSRSSKTHRSTTSINKHLQRCKRQEQRKGDVLDSKLEAFPPDVECTAPYDRTSALTTNQQFLKPIHEDAYDSTEDEGPTAADAFNGQLLSST